MTGLRLGLNTSSLQAQRSLARATTELSSIYERLSSGQRINHASDDPAGLALSEGLKSDTRVFTQAIRNINDGISLLSIAEGALDQLTSISTRQKELAEQSSNGTYSAAQRRAMHTEANALVDEFNRIIQTTEFNGINVTDLSTTELSLQAGDGTNGAVSFEIAEELARTVGTGTFGGRSSFTSCSGVMSVSLGDVNGDNILDMVTADNLSNRATVFIGNGDGTFKARASFVTGATPVAVALADVNNDGFLDMATADYTGMLQIGAASVFIGNGDGTFKARTSYVTDVNPHSISFGDVTGDGIVDMVTADYAIFMGLGAASVFVGNGDGTFKTRTSFSVGATPFSVTTVDVNQDGELDIITADRSDTVSVLLGNGDGTFKARLAFTGGGDTYAVSLADVDGDGILDMASVASDDNTASLMIGNGDGTFKARTIYTTGSAPHSVTLGDITGDGIVDMVTADSSDGTASVFIGRGDGTFGARTSYTAGTGPASVKLGDLNGDSVLDMVTADTTSNRTSVFLANTHQVSTIARLNLSTAADALAAMTTIDATLARVSAELGSVGASQSRLSQTFSILQVQRENYAAAYERITSADVAEDAANMVRLQILQQAATAVLAQANQQPALVMQLLQA